VHKKETNLKMRVPFNRKRVGKSGLRSTISEEQGKDMHFKISLSCGPKNGLSRSNKVLTVVAQLEEQEITWRRDSSTLTNCQSI